MDTPAKRIAAAVAGKPDTAAQVETDDEGKPYVVETGGIAPVLAGDVVELVKALGDKADDTARALARGAAAVGPKTIVYQRADQLRAVLALAGA
jgi:hypothetical protein